MVFWESWGKCMVCFADQYQSTQVHFCTTIPGIIILWQISSGPLEQNECISRVNRTAWGTCSCQIGRGLVTILIKERQLMQFHHILQLLCTAPLHSSCNSCSQAKWLICRTLLLSFCSWNAPENTFDGIYHEKALLLDISKKASAMTGIRNRSNFTSFI